MKGNLRKALMAVLALVLVVSCARIAYQAFQYEQGGKTYSEAEQLVQLPDLSGLPAPQLPSQQMPPSPSGSAGDSSGDSSALPAPYVDPYAEALRSMDFTALQEVNSDVLGWILIPNTNLSYPLVQGADNDYYLNHTWKKSRNSVGAIFMEWQNSRDLSDFNTIIYGHRMNNRSMFGTLSEYSSLSYWSQHPFLYLTDSSGSYQYEIFAAYEVSVSGATYQLGFSSDQSKQAFLDFCLEQSVIDTGVVPTVYDQIATLSTCTGNGHATRWIVQGVRRGEAPADSGQPPDGESPDAPSGVLDDASPAGPDSQTGGSAPIDEGPVSQDIRLQPRQEAPAAPQEDSPAGPALPEDAGA